MSKPNVLLLTIDTLRADMVGCHGYQTPTTPNIDRLAAKGIRFDQAIAGGSWTQAAFPVILTSSYASMYGGCLGPLAPERPSPIETLAAHGYMTAGFSTSPLLSRAYGYQRGFGHFVELAPQESDPWLRRVKGGQLLLRRPLTHRVSRLLGKRTRPARLYVTATEVTDHVCRFLDAAKTPYFAWAHYMDVHWPYHPEETLSGPREIAQAWRDLGDLHRVNHRGARLSAAERQRLISLYEQAVRYADGQVGRLLDHLRATGRHANTIVILTSDHGEEFLERRHWGHFETNLHDEIVRVPLIISLPAAGEGRTVARQVSAVDIMPTVLELCSIPANDRLEGASLVPLWAADEANYQAEEAISERWRPEQHLIAVRTSEAKCIWDSCRPDRPRLYDLRADPGERNDLSAKDGDQVRAFQARVEKHLNRIARTTSLPRAAAPELDQTVLRRLQDLGYVE